MPSRFAAVKDKLPRSKTKGDAKDTTAPGAKSKGKRTSVSEGSSMLTAPAQIMGPRLLFILSVVALCAMGLVMVYSASSILALNSADYGNDAAYFLKRQGLFLGIGVVVCVACAAIPYRFWANPAVFVLLWLVTVGALAMTAFGLGVQTLGAERSIVIGPFALQPAEFGKISVLLTVGSLVELQRERNFTAVQLGLVLAIAIGVPILLIYKQPDLGTVIILIVGLLALGVIVGMSLKAVAVLVVLGIGYFAIVCILQPYHIDRIMTMFDPWTDPQGKGYQSVQSLYALGSGGIFGTGLGLSRQKYLYLPYAHTDFIYAIVGEELGILGTAGVALLFGVFIFAGLRISRSAPDIYGASIVGAMTTMIGFQACVNMACVIGIAPVTGKALPFLSYGGSSILATMIMVGIILSVSMRSKVGVQAERRRDDLVVLSGRKKEPGRAEAPAASSAAAAAGALGLRVVSGLKERVSGGAPQQAQRAGRGRQTQSGRGRSAGTGGRNTSPRADRAGKTRGDRSRDSHSGQYQAQRGRGERGTAPAGQASRKKGYGASLRVEGRSSAAKTGGSRREAGAGSSSRSSRSASTGEGKQGASAARKQADQQEYRGRLKYPTGGGSARRRIGRPGSRRH